jgi:hypothetical protein
MSCLILEFSSGELLQKIILNSWRNILLFLFEVYAQHLLNFFIFLYLTYSLSPAAFGTYGTIGGIIVLSFALTDVTVNEVMNENEHKISIPFVCLKILLGFIVFESLVYLKSVPYNYHIITLLLFFCMTLWSEARVYLIKKGHMKRLIVITVVSNFMSFILAYFFSESVADLNVLLIRLFSIHIICGIVGLVYYNKFTFTLFKIEHIKLAGISAIGRLSTSVFPVLGSTIYFGYMQSEYLAAYNRYEVLGFVAISGLFQLIYRYFSLGTVSLERSYYLQRVFNTAFFFLLIVILFLWRPLTRLVMPLEYTSAESAGILLFSWLPFYVYLHIQRWLDESRNFLRSGIEDLIISALWISSLMITRSPLIASTSLAIFLLGITVFSLKSKSSIGKFVFSLGGLLYIWSINL